MPIWRLARPARRTNSPFRVNRGLGFIPLENRWLPATLTVGPNIDITRLPDNQSESSIAANPTNPLHVVAIANNLDFDGGSTFCRSTDGGVTWTSSTITNGDGFGVIGFGDGELTYDKFGNLYVVFLDDVGDGDIDCTVITSTNDGQTFSVVGSPITGNLDQPKIATGPGTTAGSASVWVSCQGTSGEIDAAGAQVTGLGAIGSFSTPVAIPGSSGGNFGSIAVGPNGQVLIAYENPTDGSGPAGIFTNIDPDGAGTQPFGVTRLATNTEVGGFRAIPAQPNRTVDAEAFLAYDRSGGVHNGRVYLVYTDAPSISSSDLNIFVRYSDDNGTSWSTPVRVNDDTGTNSQFFSGIAVDQTTGNVAVGWFDARNSSGNNSVEYFVTASIDGGNTFLPNVQVANALSDGRSTVVNDSNEFGDFYRIDFVNNVIHVVWADNSTDVTGNPDNNGSLDIASASITLSGAGGGGGGGTGTTIPTAFVGTDAGVAATVRLVNMTTNAVMFQVAPFGGSFTGGVRVARGDVNGDGTPDLIVAAGPGGGPHIKVYDGATHAVIYSYYAYTASFTGGVFVASADVNGDGKADIITGAGPGGSPHVRVFSGADGSLLTQFFAYSSSFRGGVSVAGGDINGDGKADISTGAGPGGGPHVKVFSGADDSVLRSYFAYDATFRGGVVVAAGDVNGDGMADIITAPSTKGTNVKVYSGVTGNPTVSFTAKIGNSTVGQLTSDFTSYQSDARIAAIDFNGDGLDDIIVVPGAGAVPEGQVFDAVTATSLDSFSAFGLGFLGGVFVG